MANLLGAIGQAKPVTEFVNTIGQYQTTQSNLESQRLAQQKAQMDIAQAEKDNKEYHVDAVAALYPENHRENIKKMWTLSGMVSPDGVIRGKDIRSTPELYKKYPEIALSTNIMEIEALEKKAKSDKVTPEEKLKIADDLTDLHKKNAFLRGKEGSVQGIDPEKDVWVGGQKVASGTPKPIKGRMIPIYAPESPTDYFYGDPSTGEMTEMAAPPPKSAAEKDNPFNSWKESFIESNGRKPSPQEVMDWHRAGSVNINLNKDLVKGAIKTLPALKEKAKSSNNGIARIDRMIELINKGAGGRVGQVKAWLAPTLEAVGYKSQGLAEAQMYETLAKTLGGSMRMEIVGPGVVSDYEQKLLAKVSAGGSTATDAAKELLTYYRGIAESNIRDYNDTVESVSEETPAATRVYRPIGKDKAPPAPGGKFKILKVE